MSRVIFLILIFAAQTKIGLAKNISFLSFNTGLAHGFVPYADQRLMPILFELNGRDESDIVCLSEVWDDGDKKKIINQMKKKYPYHVLSKSKQMRESGVGQSCKKSDLFGKGKFLDCIESKCKGKEGAQKDLCISNDCKDSLFNLAKDRPYCAKALIASVGKNPIIAGINLLNPLWKAGIFSYGGSFGTMILSKYKIVESGHLEMTDISTSVHRGLLHAKIKIGSREIIVGCTHLSANLANVPYINKKFSGELIKGWAFENQEQINRVNIFFNKYNLPKVFMGDMNFGPTYKGTNVEEDFENSYHLSLKYGWIDTYQNSIVKECTFCKANTLTDGSEKNMKLDHIFIKDFKSMDMRPSKVVMKGKRKIKVNNLNKVEDHNVSDHFGVRWDVEL